MNKGRIFWDLKEQYFVGVYAGNPPADRMANLRLLEALLDQAYEAGYDDCKNGLDKARHFR